MRCPGIRGMSLEIIYLQRHSRAEAPSHMLGWRRCLGTCLGQDALGATEEQGARPSQSHVLHLPMWALRWPRAQRARRLMLATTLEPSVRCLEVWRCLGGHWVAVRIPGAPAWMVPDEAVHVDEASSRGESGLARGVAQP